MIDAAVCDLSSPSIVVPGHVHACNGSHLCEGDGYAETLHKCGDAGCRRWFGVRR